ncbi:hypothetical protein HMPREF9709_01675 [Helcococcus kunzii ATCC 51366]|uniref:Mannose-6-phosphate isomerase n=1 Tax=Helcococcus kunzii ATCC 51366 TaxID=883114 RepID=H3NQR4_9FIRM|nr:class I mannose-6-phosphate isomerase [Helcococcus kunzii]EHR32061.1 hypothetical protein HMPREF9709_01675 [Helcococcus kunzii ATCC 51366]
MYRQRPFLKIKSDIEILCGYKQIFSFINSTINDLEFIAFETYPGINKQIWIKELEENFPHWNIVNTDEFFIDTKEINNIINLDLTDDPQFGRISRSSFSDFVDNEKIKSYEYKRKTIFIGILAGLLFKSDLKFYVDITRQNIQKNYINGLNNWKVTKEMNSNQKLKRAYFFEWPAADQIKINNLNKFDYYISDDVGRESKMISLNDLKTILEEFVNTPFRLVPFFAPGVWGGQYLKNKFELQYNEVNLAWIFDGVLEENSILAKKEEHEIEIPGNNLLFMFPVELLGEKVFGRYGADFPIRFNLLDTFKGQNLSLQVHPTLDYAYRSFGLKYTQNESYYVFHADEDSSVYLGMKNGITKDQLFIALEEAKESNVFDDKKYINKFKVKKHDHILIPAGTIHSSGANTVVLEISATQNRFTFKLWDWNRLDLNGKPRPISLKHGKNVINEKVDYDFAKEELINDFKIINNGKYVLEEKTGLHKLEDIETRRITIAKEYKQVTYDSVNVLNLVEGDSAIISSLNGEFDDYLIYYGETVIIPENIKEYVLKPGEDEERVIFIKAFIK